MELRQDRMSHKERKQALYRYQKPDRVPMTEAGHVFSMVNVGYTAADAFTNPQRAFDGLIWTCEQYGWDPAHNMTSAHVCLGSWDFGAKVKVPESPYSQGLGIVENAVKTEEDVWNLERPDPRTAGAIPTRMEFGKLLHKAGLPVAFLSRSPFCTGADICGIARFCKWMYRKPELCHRLIQIGMKHTLAVIQYWVDTFGAENVFYLMSSPTESNQIISTRHLEEFALPYHREFHQRLRAMGIGRFLFHVCGEQNLNLPFLAQLAADPQGWPHPSILSFGHEVDVEDAARHFPEDIILGNIEPALFQTATPQEVYETCRATIEKGKRIPGGFILAPGCAMAPRAPSYNVWMMTKAVNDFGWYE